MTATLVEERATPSRHGPLRVCHVVYSFYETDNRVIRYAERMSQDGHAVDVISLRREGQSRGDVIKGVRIHRIQRRSVSERHAWQYLLKVLWFFAKTGAILTVRHARRPYDVVHVHNVPDFLVFSALAPRLSGAGIILDIHDVLPELYASKFDGGGESRLFRALVAVERLSCRFAHHVIIANHLWFDRVTRRSVPPARCSVMLNYPDLDLFRPVAVSERCRRGGFTILYPGTLNEHQGLDLAIRAFDLVRNRMPDATLQVYGEGPARESLEDLVRELGLGDRIAIRGRVPLVQVAEIMAAANLGVVPKRADGFGNEAFSTKILEFMACGVPVVVSRTRVDAHYFDDRVVRFFTPGDVQGLADALLWAYEHPEEAATMAKSGLAFADANSWQLRADDYRGIVEALVTRRAGSVGSPRAH